MLRPVSGGFSCPKAVDKVQYRVQVRVSAIDLSHCSLPPLGPATGPLYRLLSPGPLLNSLPCCALNSAPGPLQAPVSPAFLLCTRICPEAQMLWDCLASPGELQAGQRQPEPQGGAKCINEQASGSRAWRCGWLLQGPHWSQAGF